MVSARTIGNVLHYYSTFGEFQQDIEEHIHTGVGCNDDGVVCNCVTTIQMANCQKGKI
jgi:Golgi nucleoside diphosphatase